MQRYVMYSLILALVALESVDAVLGDYDPYVRFGTWTILRIPYFNL